MVISLKNSKKSLLFTYNYKPVVNRYDLFQKCKNQQKHRQNLSR